MQSPAESPAKVSVKLRASQGWQTLVLPPCGMYLVEMLKILLTYNNKRDVPGHTAHNQPGGLGETLELAA